MKGSQAASRAMRLGTVCVVLVGMVLTLGWPGFAVGAAAPETDGKPVSTTPQRFPDHQAEQEAFDRIRQAPPGVSVQQARLAALKQAQSLPAAGTLPAALGGKGTPVRDALAPPSAVWQPLGPAPEDMDTFNPNNDFHYGHVSGRTTAVVIGPHTGIIYIGTAGGGVWKSLNDGASWTPLTDKQQSLSIGAMVLDPADTTDRTLYAGTGEAHFSADSYNGVGILKTTDGGATWTLVGTGFPNVGTYNGSSVAVSMLAFSGTVLLVGTSAGLYRSTDAGANWTQITVAAGQPSARVTDVQADGANVYVVVSNAMSGISFTGIYKSTTGGSTGSFNPLSSPNLPAATSWGRSQVTIARSAPLTLYLAIAYGTNDPTTANQGNLLGIFKTTDGGATWNAASSAGNPDNYFGEPGLPGQGWYDNVIAVDPTNPNLVYAGGVAIVSSSDGGAHWVTMMDPYCDVLPCPPGSIHPDQHGTAFGLSGTPRPFYVGNDGGVWKTTNGNLGTSATWSDLNGNLATLQPYAGDAANNYQATPFVAEGSQDNGTAGSTSPTNGTWNGLLGGDGFYVAIDKTNTNIVYAEYANGFLQKTTNASAGSAITWTNIAPYAPTSPPCNVRFVLFNTPFVLDQNDHNHLLYGARDIACESMDGGTTWRPSTIQSGFFDRSVAIAPTDSATMYVGVNGTAYKSTNGHGASAATFSSCGTGLPASGLTRIIADPTDANTAYVTNGNFGVGHVWKSVSCGAWTNITGNLPDAPATSIVAYPITGGEALVVGTDVGVFVSTNNGTSWSALQNGLPNAITAQVFTDVARTTLFVATHGRGVFKMPIPASDAFAAPTVTSIVSPVGPDTGGAPVTITGTGFRAGAAVYFDGIPATNVVVVNATTITATTPAHQDGKANIVVVNADNQGGTLVQGYTFGPLSPLPGSKPSSGSGSPAPAPGSRPSGSSQGSPGVLPNPAPRG